MPYLSVIIPAYNEEKRIGNTLDAIYCYLIEQSYSWEILVVLDGPQDQTLAVVKAFAQDKKQVRIIDRKQNYGKGYTVRQGMLAARGDIRLFTDADNSTDISHFEEMRPYFTKDWDVVIASRDAKDAPGARQAVPQPPLKRLLGNAGNLFIQIMAVPGIWDTQCGFKAFTAPAAVKVFSAAKSNGWVFDIEALALARRFKFKTAVIGANWIDDANTHVNLWNYLGSLLETIKIRWQLVTGAYDRRLAAESSAAAETPAIAPDLPES